MHAIISSRVTALVALFLCEQQCLKSLRNSQSSGAQRKAKQKIKKNRRNR
jgi:hypothetical protein